MSRNMPSLNLSERNHFLDSNKGTTEVITVCFIPPLLYRNEACDLKVLEMLRIKY